LDDNPIIIGDRPKRIGDANHEIYQKMSSEDERNILMALLGEGGNPIETLLGIGDVYSIVREEYNNDILERWAEYTRQGWLDGIESQLLKYGCELQEDYHFGGVQYPFVVELTHDPSELDAEVRDSVADITGPVCFYTLDDLTSWLVKRGWIAPGDGQTPAAQ
jgi:hypothetical protein